MFIIAVSTSVSANFITSVISSLVYIDLLSSWICLQMCSDCTCLHLMVSRACRECGFAFLPLKKLEVWLSRRSGSP